MKTPQQSGIRDVWKMNFTPIKLTIVDFLGVFIPGTIWIVLFASLRDTIILTCPDLGSTLVECCRTDPNPLNEGLHILTLFDDKYGTIFYLGLALVAVILGYLNMSLSTEFTEWLSHLDVWIKSLCNSTHEKNKENENQLKNKQYINNVFPYENTFQEMLFFQSINDYMVKRFNSFVYDERIKIKEKIEAFSALNLPLYQPFESCKRFLKLHAPSLWEEVQYREGQVRLLSSLFLSSIFNFILAIWNYLLIEKSAHNFMWFFISILIMVYLGYIFRLRRLREVQDVYLSTFIVLIDQNSEKNEKN